MSLDIPVRICREIHRSSGITGLWTPGLSATVCREILYSGCTKGIYPLARTAISGGKHASDITLTERALAAGLRRVGERLRGSPRTRPRQPRGAFRRGALTTDLQLTSAHWLVALAKSSSQRAAPARPEVLATATQATSGHALGA